MELQSESITQTEVEFNSVDQGLIGFNPAAMSGVALHVISCVRYISHPLA